MSFNGTKKLKVNGFRLDVSKILLPTRVYYIESGSDRDRERERTTPLLPPTGKFLHGYPIANIRLVEAFMHTKKVSALVTTISADKLSL